MENINILLLDIFELIIFEKRYKDKRSNRAKIKMLNTNLIFVYLELIINASNFFIPF